MLIKEFISETNKNQLIAKILKYYGVGSVKLKHKYMDNHAHYDVDRGVLELSKKYKVIKPNQLKEFLITIIHETYHAIDAKKYGWRKFKDMYEYEMNYQIAMDKDEYDDNKYEIAAEKFGQQNYSKWLQKFKKEGLI